MIPGSQRFLPYCIGFRTIRADPDWLRFLFVAPGVKGKPLRRIEFNCPARDAAPDPRAVRLDYTICRLFITFPEVKSGRGEFRTVQA